MIVIHCPQCVMNFRLLEDDSLVGTSSEFWPDKYTCPTCSSKCQGVHEAVVSNGAPIRDIQPEELYAAMHGLGLPGEMLCDGDTVRAFLQSGVSRVVGFEVPGTTRFVIEQIVAKDGSRLYLGASPHGAVVYRITRKHNYTEKVLEKIDG